MESFHEEEAEVPNICPNIEEYGAIFKIWKDYRDGFLELFLTVVEPLEGVCVRDGVRVVRGFAGGEHQLF